MKIMVNLEGTDSCREFNILQDNMTVLTLKTHLSKIYSIPPDQMDLLLNDCPLNDKQIVNQVGIDDNLLLLRRKNANVNSIQTPQTPNIANSNILANSNLNYGQNQNRINNSIYGLQNSNRLNQSVYTPQNPNIINSNALYGQRNPNLSNSVNALGLSQSSLINDAIAYNELLGISQNSPEAQRRIERIIQQQRINDNFRQAAEYMPESLFPVHMLFINVELNNIKVPALVDTGAQSTFMSKDLCQKCGLMNMVDKRFQGVARGVGSSRIVGVIHAAQIKIMNKMIATKINVIENNEVGLVFGLDSLRAHRCNVDLKQNGLVFPDIGITAKFLSDGEIKKMKQNRELERENEEIERAKKESLNYV